jgi:thioredoxin-related protein
VKAHIKEHPVWFHRFDAVWTPTVLLLDSEGKERVRLEGYLPNGDFIAALISGLGRIAFVQKKYSDAERRYGEVLGKVAEELRSTYPSSIWASKAIPWLH